MHKTRTQAVQELRRSSAASPHTPARRRGTRGARKTRALSEQEQGR